VPLRPDARFLLALNERPVALTAPPPGAKELAVRTELGLSAARYYQVLNALLDSPEALRADPMLVKRLRRIRDARVEARRVRQFRASAAANDHE
jgi:hypothetical protein